MAVATNPFALMDSLARMAGIQGMNYRRMVLVLDIEEVPRLYVEQLLRDAPEQLPDTPLTVIPGKCPEIDLNQNPLRIG